MLHGNGVTLTGLLSARGGDGGPAGIFHEGSVTAFVGGGGGGGGGRVVIDPGAGGFTTTGGTIDVSGGGAGGARRPGQVLVVSEPMSWILACIGGLVLGGSNWYHRRRVAA